MKFRKGVAPLTRKLSEKRFDFDQLQKGQELCSCRVYFLAEIKIKATFCFFGKQFYSISAKKSEFIFNLFDQLC